MFTRRATNKFIPTDILSLFPEAAWVMDQVRPHGAGLLYLVLRGTVKGHRSEERVSDDWVADEWVADVLGNCHGRFMAMTVFMTMAMGVPCYGHDHAMTAVINMVMAVTWSCSCHS